MSAAERNFYDFELGDNVYELADGLIPEVAEALEVNIGEEPNSEGLSQLVGALGKNKVLRDNDEVEALTTHEMADFVDRSGVQQALSRSLWTPDISPVRRGVDIAVLTGAVANWQDRAAKLVTREHEVVYVATGNRTMNSPGEIAHHDVTRFESVVGRYPTESEYAAALIVPGLVNYGRRQVVHTQYPISSGAEIASRFFEENPRLLEDRLIFMRVANAGVQFAVEMRKAARKLNVDFDTDPDNPQVYVITDDLEVAREAWQDEHPRAYQKAQTGLRQVAVTAKSLFEASQSY